METIEKSIEVEAPVRQVYNQWTQFEEFPHFMEGVEEVRQLDDKHLHWVAKVAGRVKEWDAEILEQIPDDRIAWRSTSGAPNSGVVHFRPADQNRTVVTLRLSYEPEGAMENIGSAMGVLSGRVEADLRKFKDFIQHRGTETGSWRGEIRHGDLRGSASLDAAGTSDTSRPPGSTSRGPETSFPG
ncbi:MAG TPA: SRPBCC family protein [Verrucomicrobiae bacterium]|nr:SRPBCC family protein [Verrucomicrobiae bacterium]